MSRPSFVSSDGCAQFVRQFGKGAESPILNRGYVFNMKRTWGTRVLPGERRWSLQFIENRIVPGFFAIGCAEF